MLFPEDLVYSLSSTTLVYFFPQGTELPAENVFQPLIVGVDLTLGELILTSIEKCCGLSP